MSLNAKIAIVLTAATAVFAPIAAANAGETSTGATAAAVSIKFNECSKKCGGTEGGFSITPGGNTTGFGTGVRELSAAVATGETSAKAKSSSDRFGTSATASGYSAPVTFHYEVIKSHDSHKFGLDTAYNSQYENGAALEFAKNSKNSNYHELSKEAAGYNKNSKGKKGGSESGYEASKEVKNGSSSENHTSANASYNASGSQHGSTTVAAETTNNYSRVGYTYHGPSAAIKNLPAIGH